MNKEVIIYIKDCTGLSLLNEDIKNKGKASGIMLTRGMIKMMTRADK